MQVTGGAPIGHRYSHDERPAPDSTCGKKNLRRFQATRSVPRGPAWPQVGLLPGRHLLRVVPGIDVGQVERPFAMDLRPFRRWRVITESRSETASFNGPVISR